METCCTWLSVFEFLYVSTGPLVFALPAYFVCVEMFIEPLRISHSAFLFKCYAFQRLLADVTVMPIDRPNSAQWLTYSQTGLGFKLTSAQNTCSMSFPE
jgi:hypothetical protein